MGPLSTFDLFSTNAQECLELMNLKFSAKGPYLLGIDCCHLNSPVQVLDKNGDRHPDDLFVRDNNGMAGVIPAWVIAEVLDVARRRWT